MVSGTGERTIATWAALALVVGLALSAAPAAHSATSETEGPATETTSEETDDVDEEGGTDDDDADSPSPTLTTSPTTTQTPTPTDSPEPEPSEPTNGQDNESNGEDSSDDEETIQPPEISCQATSMVPPGGTLTITCTVTPSHAVLTLSDGSRQSPFGTIYLVDKELTFEANSEVQGPQSVVLTVHATHPDDEEVVAAQDVTFTIEPHANGESTTDPTNGTGQDQADGDGDAEGSTPDSGTSSDSSESATTPTPSETPPGTETEPPDQPEATESTSTAQSPGLPPPPGAPGDASADPPHSVFPHLPVPGMPGPRSLNITPEPTADASEDSADSGTDDRAGEDEPEDDEGLLAQTGPEQVAWSGSLAASAIVLGITALALSRRQPQRSSGSR